jgi:hypothetical protein
MGEGKLIVEGMKVKPGNGDRREADSRGKFQKK